MPYFDAEKMWTDGAAENAAGHLLIEGTGTYLVGRANLGNPHTRALAETMIRQGSTVIRLGGQAMAHLFDLERTDLTKIVDTVAETANEVPPVTCLTSVIAANMVEGLWETDRTKAAAALFEDKVTHPEARDQVLHYLLAHDEAITGKF